MVVRAKTFSLNIFHPILLIHWDPSIIAYLFDLEIVTRPEQHTARKSNGERSLFPRSFMSEYDLEMHPHYDTYQRPDSWHIERVDSDRSLRIYIQFI